MGRRARSGFWWWSRRPVSGSAVESWCSLVHAEARRRGGRQVVDDARDALLHRAGTEVEQEADSEIREPEVGEELLGMDRCRPLRGLQLDDDAAFHQQV